MMDTGVELDMAAVRVTEIADGGFGQAKVYGPGFSVRLTPVIVAGKNTRWPADETQPAICVSREPDRFQYWEVSVADKRCWWRRLLNRRRFPRDSALEFWTADTDGWIHWMFPHITLNKNLSGRTHTGTPLPADDFPDGEPGLSDGGFWKTTTPPPLSRRAVT